MIINLFVYLPKCLILSVEVVANTSSA